MPATAHVLCIHGVNTDERDLTWQVRWQEMIERGVALGGSGIACTFTFLDYNEEFAQASLGVGTVGESLGRLGGSLLVHGAADVAHDVGERVGSFFTRLNPFRSRAFGMASVSDTLRWTAGMISQWSADEALRRRLRRLFADAIHAQRPDLICAHSLGSLLAYDALRGEPGLLRRGSSPGDGTTLLTFGSQIGNPAVRGTFGGRIETIPNARKWFQLFNDEDAAFTASLKRLRGDNFEEIETDFDIPGVLDHDAIEYLSHHRAQAEALADVGRTLAGGGTRVRGMSPRLVRRLERIVPLRRPREPDHRALLVGINDYPDPSMRLEGCVNDAWRMSEILQERGFPTDNIRLLLDRRATRDELVDRISWLLDSAVEGDVRVLFYSGHGAQLPSYGANETVDTVDECLVPADFDWTREHALTDDDFHEYYTQLPYGVQFITIFDCCHSGGMTRDGQGRPRGLTPPDDIRHRALRWDAEEGMWVPRELQTRMDDLVSGNKAMREKAVGKSGHQKKLGRGSPVWGNARDYGRAKARYKHAGPYAPVLIYACAEDQLALEYDHGAQAYGAFTYSMTRMLREIELQSREPPSFRQLVAATKAQLGRLGYEQTPQLVGPRRRLGEKVPGTPLRRVRRAS